LAGNEPIFYIDTENGRALHYARKYQFQHGNLKAPFSPERYEEALEAAIAAKAGVVVVDSMSHEHEGPGGILEQHETELQRMAGSDWNKREKCQFSAWIKPKAAHNRLVNRILQMNVHLIFCFRAKDKLILVKNEKGKQEPVSIGWTPISADRLDYEMTMMLVLPPGSEGRPDLTAKATKLTDEHAGIIRNGQQISEDMGAALRRWADGGDAVPANGEKIRFAQAQAPTAPTPIPASEEDPLAGRTARALATIAGMVKTPQNVESIEGRMRGLITELSEAMRDDLKEHLVSALAAARTESREIGRQAA
jgi:hypothetical protein